MSEDRVDVSPVPKQVHSAPQPEPRYVSFQLFPVRAVARDDELRVLVPGQDLLVSIEQQIERLLWAQAPDGADQGDVFA
jgi:hypothetical protein